LLLFDAFRELLLPLLIRATGHFRAAGATPAAAATAATAMPSRLPTFRLATVAVATTAIAFDCLPIILLLPMMITPMPSHTLMFVSSPPERRRRDSLL